MDTVGCLYISGFLHVRHGEDSLGVGLEDEGFEAHLDGLCLRGEELLGTEGVGEEDEISRLTVLKYCSPDLTSFPGQICCFSRYHISCKGNFI